MGIGMFVGVIPSKIPRGEHLAELLKCVHRAGQFILQQVRMAPVDKHQDLTQLVLKSYLTWNPHLCYTPTGKLFMRIRA
jgi:hypothetical protein